MCNILTIFLSVYIGLFMLKELSARQFLLDVVLIFLLYQESLFHECLVLSQISVVQHQ